MAELGARLKEARLSKGFSLDDLQEITKIQKRYLVAIEEGNYSTMPGTFYVRAFIKQYAEAVGLNAEELLEEYKKEIPNQQSEEVAQSISQSPTRRKLNTRSSSRMMESMPKFIVALFIIVIIILIWVLFQKKMADTGQEDIAPVDTEFEYDQKETPPPTDTNKDEKSEEPITNDNEDETDTKENDDESVVDDEMEQSISEGEVQSDGVTTNYTVTAPKLLIRVEVSGDTWVGIRDSNGEEQVNATTYKNGQTVEFDATENKYARIRLGNSRNAKVFVNNQEIQYVQDIVTQNIVIILNEEQ